MLTAAARAMIALCLAGCNFWFVLDIGGEKNLMDNMFKHSFKMAIVLDLHIYFQNFTLET